VLFAFSTILRILLLIFAPQVKFAGQIPKLISFNKVFTIFPPFAALTRPFIGKKKKELKDKE
jgi:hypothetical protein